MGWKVIVEPWLRPLFHIYSRFSRGVSLKVLGLVVNADGEVLLVRSGAHAAWTLPEGVVAYDHGPEAALAEAVQGASGIKLKGRPALLGIERSSGSTRGHRLLYRSTELGPIVEDGTVKRGESRWVRPGQLPTDIVDQAKALIEAAL